VEGKLSAAHQETTFRAAPGLFTVAVIQSINNPVTSWTAATGAVGYNVYRGASADAAPTKLTTTPVTGVSYTDMTASAGVTYFYRVTSVDSAGVESAFSAAQQATIYLAAPGEFTVTVDQASNKPVVSWTAATGAAGYSIYRGASADATPAKLTTTPVTSVSYTDTTASAGMTYFYTVVAINNAGVEGIMPAAQQATTLPVITSFSFTDPAATGIINGDAITVELPSDRALTALVPTIVYGGASVSPASETAQDFSSPVQYTVTAQNGSAQQTYTVAVLTSTPVSAPTLISAPANMVLVPAGTFTMGSPSSEANRSSHETPYSVTISKAFYMGTYEVTHKEWVAVMGSNPSNWKGDNLPVETVSWYNAVEYCNKLSKKEGLTPAYTISGTDVTWNMGANGYRLPTEAEWEYACRAETTTPYSRGSSVDNGGWYSSNSGSKTHEVGEKQANAWGIYDMHGNVWEWCWSWYGSYAKGSQTDPTGAASGTSRVVRGGSWYSNTRFLRSASRLDYTPNSRRSFLGFRVVRS
jgi:formylglycine-generating enzyme required for sulfatase activity